MSPRRDPAGVAALLAASTIWGASFVLAKVALAELAVAHVLTYRFVLAVLPFLPVLLAGGVRPARRDLGLFALTGLLMVPITFLLQVGGLVFTSATSAALLVGTGAPLLALAAVLFEGERLGRRGWSAVAVSSLGVLLLVGMPGAGDDWRGNLMVLLSMIISTAWVIMSKRLIGRYPALQATGWILLFGTVFLVGISLAWEGPPPVDLTAGVWASLLGLGLGCTSLAYVLWNWGVARVGAGPAGVYLNLEPIAGALLGVMVVGDPVGAGMVAGGAAIVAAAGIVSTRHSDSSLPERAPAKRRSWWLEGRPSLRAELALRRFGFALPEPTRGVDGIGFASEVPLQADSHGPGSRRPGDDARRSLRDRPVQPATGRRRRRRRPAQPQGQRDAGAGSLRVGRSRPSGEVRERGLPAARRSAPG